MQDLYLQLQNLKRTDKYCLIFIASLFLCLAIKILATDPLQNSINTSRDLLEEKQQNLNNYLAFAEQYKDYSALQKQQNEDQNKDQNKDQQNSGGQDQNQDKNKDNNSDKDRQQDKGGEQQDQQDRQNGQNDPDKNGQNPDEQPQDSDKPDSDDRQPGQPRENGISLEEQERMLDAIQAQEDKTQEKLKEKAGVAVRGNKNW